MFRDNPGKSSDTIESHGIVFFPTVSFLEKMFENIGFDHRQLDYHGVVTDWAGMSGDYKKRGRVSYVGTRR